MSTDIHITSTYGRCDVRVAGTTRRFDTIEAALTFARDRLEDGRKLRELSARCE